jgi:hypothetical protein
MLVVVIIKTCKYKEERLNEHKNTTILKDKCKQQGSQQNVNIVGEFT